MSIEETIEAAVRRAIAEELPKAVAAALRGERRRELTDDPWLTVAQASEHSGYSRDFIYRLVDTGGLAACQRKHRASIRIRRSALDAFIEGMEKPTAVEVDIDELAGDIVRAG